MCTAFLSALSLLCGWWDASEKCISQDRWLFGLAGRHDGCSCVVDILLSFKIYYAKIQDW